MKASRIKVAVLVAAVSTALVIPVAGVAFADGGAAGGDFNCRMTGVPGWGSIYSSYNHPDKQHWATASGLSYETVERPAGEVAVARADRNVWGNECFYGTR